MILQLFSIHSMMFFCSEENKRFPIAMFDYWRVPMMERDPSNNDWRRWREIWISWLLTWNQTWFCSFSHCDPLIDVLPLKLMLPIAYPGVWMTDCDPKKIVSQKIIDATQFEWNVHKMFFHVLSQIIIKMSHWTSNMEPETTDFKDIFWWFRSGT